MKRFFHSWGRPVETRSAYVRDDSCSNGKNGGESMFRSIRRGSGAEQGESVRSSFHRESGSERGDHVRHFVATRGSRRLVSLGNIVSAALASFLMIGAHLGFVSRGGSMRHATAAGSGRTVGSRGSSVRNGVVGLLATFLFAGLFSGAFSTVAAAGGSALALTVAAGGFAVKSNAL